MKSINYFFLLLLSIILLDACQPKKTPPPPPVVVAERMEISPASQAILLGEQATFKTTFYDELGEPTEDTPEVTWTSSNEAVATIDANGVATSQAAGQTSIIATYGELQSTALLTVVSNTQADNAIASITISPNQPELLLNETLQLNATAKNIAGNTLNGKVFTWLLASGNNFIDISNNGLVTAKSYGTAEVNASSEGIQSTNRMVAVVRKGNFAGQNGYNVSGEAKLKVQNGNIQLVFANNFSTSGGPDLRVYLSNSSSGITDGIELALLQKNNGTQTYNIPSGATMTSHRYVIIWCKQFSVTFGAADLGE